LHFACYRNAPFSAIESLIKIWPEGLNETVEMVNELDGYRYDAPALELACGAGAPDEVISVLAQTSRQLGYRIDHVPGEILMDMNRDLNLLKKIYDPWEWRYHMEHLFRPQKEFHSYNRRAFYRLHHNDRDLSEVRVGWPLPSLYALESVVEALATNTEVYRLDIREGDTNLYPDATEMMEERWWYGRGQIITDLITSGLQRNTSITEIHLKGVKGMNLYHFVNIVRCCRQLEKVQFHRMIISKEEMSYILMQLRVDEVNFTRCIISEEVAQVAVNTLRNFQHPFLRVYLFNRVSSVTPEWHEGIETEIYHLTWSNNFRLNRNRFINGLHDHGTRFKQKLYYYCREGRICYYDLLKTRCRNRDIKLWYAAIMAAVEYDKLYKCFSQEGEPNMLYSLIREHPDNLKFV
jgi:hypothetical protein